MSQNSNNQATLAGDLYQSFINLLHIERGTMKREKADRRIKYTKMMLKNGIIALLEEYPISKITVKKLCETADINRSTFYAHYSDTQDLLQQLEQEVSQALIEHISQHTFTEKTKETEQVLNVMLEYIGDNSDLFKVLLGENGNSSFQKDIMRITQQKSIADLYNDKNIDARTSEYIQCFLLSGSLSIIEEWLQDGMVEAPQEISELIVKLLYEGLLGVTES